jgi:DNA replication protein DnaC
VSTTVDPSVICPVCHEPKTHEAALAEGATESGLAFLRQLGMKTIPRQCACERARLMREEAEITERNRRVRLASRIDGAGFPAIYRDASLEVTSTVKENDEAFRACRAYVKHALSMSLALIGGETGGVGVGKTHLAVATARAIIREHDVSALYWNHPQTMAKLRRHWSRNEFEEAEAVMESAERCGLLVLDEIGLVQMTERDLERFYALVDYRWSNLQPWILTSNHDRAALVERIGAPIVDRLFDERTTIALRLSGPSRRLRGAATNNRKEQK